MPFATKAYDVRDRRIHGQTDDPAECHILGDLLHELPLGAHRKQTCGSNARSSLSGGGHAVEAPTPIVTTPSTALPSCWDAQVQHAPAQVIGGD